MLTAMQRKQVAERALSAAAVLGRWLEGEKVIGTLEELDAAFDSVIELLEECRDDAYRLGAPDEGPPELDVER